MISVPARLIGMQSVRVLLRSPNAMLLHKSLASEVLERSSYLSMHAASLVLSGEQVIRSEAGTTLHLRSGDMGFLRRGLYTLTDLLAGESHYESLVLFWDDELVEGTSAGNPMPDQAPLFRESMGRLEKLFVRQVFDLAESLPGPDGPFAELKIREFFSLLSQHKQGTEILEKLACFARPTARNLREFLELHFDKPLKVADYAWLTGKSLSTFRREFQLKFGQTPRKWLIQKRMSKARELLEAGEKSVSQLALAVGYENVSHFIREFRKEFGFTPGQITQKENS